MVGFLKAATHQSDPSSSSSCRRVGRAASWQAHVIAGLRIIIIMIEGNWESVEAGYDACPRQPE